MLVLLLVFLTPLFTTSPLQLTDTLFIDRHFHPLQPAQVHGSFLLDSISAVHTHLSVSFAFSLHIQSLLSMPVLNISFSGYFHRLTLQLQILQGTALPSMPLSRFLPRPLITALPAGSFSPSDTPSFSLGLGCLAHIWFSCSHTWLGRYFLGSPHHDSYLRSLGVPVRGLSVLTLKLPCWFVYILRFVFLLLESELCGDRVLAIF